MKKVLAQKSKIGYFFCVSNTSTTMTETQAQNACFLRLEKESLAGIQRQIDYEQNVLKLQPRQWLIDMKARKEQEIERLQKLL